MNRIGGYYMGRWLLNVLLNTVVLLIIDSLFSGVYLHGIWGALLTAIVLSILNMLVKPILVLITLPITFLTLGLFYFIINAITLKLADVVMGSSFEIESFGTAILASLVLSIITTFVVKPLLD